MSEILAAGAGAGEGLDTMLTRMMEEEKLAEMRRSNQANEGLKGREIDENAAYRGLTAQSQADLRDQQRQGLQRSADEETARQAFEDRLRNDPNTPVSERNYLDMRRAVPRGENVPYEVVTQPNGPRVPPVIRDTKESGLVDLTDVNNPRAIAAPGTGGVLHGFHTDPPPPPSQALPTDSGYAAFDPRHPGAPVQPIVGTDGQQVQPRASAAATQKGVDKQTGIAAVDRLSTDIDRAAAAGLLGPGSGRAYNALAQLGTTGDKAKDELVGRIKGDLLLTKMHIDAGIGGARAAGSPLLLERWEDLAMKSSPELLRGYLSGMREDMSGSGVAAAPGAHPGQMGQAGGGVPGVATPPPAADAYQQYLDHLAGK